MLRFDIGQQDKYYPGVSQVIVLGSIVDVLNEFSIFHITIFDYVYRMDIHKIIPRILRRYRSK